MNLDWLTTTGSDALRIIVSSVGVLLAVVALIRLNGLRSLSKMASADFAVTVAVGSIVASTLLSASVSLLEGVIGVAALLGAQRLMARARASAGADALFDNAPTVLMVGDRLLDDTLARVRVTEADVYGKLREANAVALSQVYAVVLEATGDISVLHGPRDELPDRRLLEGVRGGPEALDELQRRRDGFDTDAGAR